MIIIPAVDIRDGKCVRLFQGRGDRETVYGDDPAAMALRWQREGAAYLHVVDLDGAFGGSPQNLGALGEMLARLTIPMEFGGGLREIGMVRRVFKMGVDRVILGTAALRDRAFLKAAVSEFGRQVFAGIDVRGGRAAIEGWTADSGMTPRDVLASLEEAGVGGVVCTDIARDGALSGPNLGLLAEMIETAAVPVIASGGVRTIGHVKELRALGGEGLFGAIIGRALYTGDLSLREAIRAAA